MSRLHTMLRAAPNPPPATLQSASIRSRFIPFSFYGPGFIPGRTRRQHLAGDPPPPEPVKGAWYVVVMLLPELRIVRAQWADPFTGEFRFEWIDPTRKYLVLSRDHLELFNAELYDRITPTRY